MADTVTVPRETLVRWRRDLQAYRDAATAPPRWIVSELDVLLAAPVNDENAKLREALGALMGKRESLELARALLTADQEEK